MRVVAIGLLLLATVAPAAAAENRLVWGPVVSRAAPGCDAFTPVRGPNGYHYTSFGDCAGLTGRSQQKLSMGFGRVLGGPANVTVQDLPTPDLRDYGSRDQGRRSPPAR